MPDCRWKSDGNPGFYEDQFWFCPESFSFISLSFISYFCGFPCWRFIAYNAPLLTLPGQSVLTRIAPEQS
jgi:hypothetical protein